MSREFTVPLLPCADLDDMVAFYEVLGFRTTYRQRRPNPCAGLRREDLHLQVFEIAGFDPAQSYGSCLVLTPDPGELHRAFATGMRAAYGKVLVSGTPRMTRPRARKNAGGVSGFSVVDPGGNWIRVFQRTGAGTEADSAPAGTRAGVEGALADTRVEVKGALAGTGAGAEGAPAGTGSGPEPTLAGPGPGPGSGAGAEGAVGGRLARALANAVVLADSKGDARQAAKVLDGALARAEPGEDPVVQVEVLVYRAEVALVLDDPVTAAVMLGRAGRVPLSLEDAARAGAAFETAADLGTALP